jgi:hypothetical protein
MNLSELSAVALIGTERQGVSRPQNGVVALAAQLDSEKREHELLSLAAIYALQGVAGHSLGKSDALPPLEREQITDQSAERPVAPTKAIVHLTELIAGGDVRWVLEWLRQAQRLGYRLPATQSASFLAFANNRPELRKVCSPALLGRRGVWLAQCNVDWKWALKTNSLNDSEIENIALDPNIFELGTIEERLAWLKAERQRDPAAARERLQQVWPKESGDDRGVLIGVLSAQLSMDDEPFLEQCLGDRKQIVRDQVMAFLRRLPQSGFVQRHFGRLQQYLSFQGNTIEVNLPASYEKAWKRDGIDEKAYGMGEKSWWLQQMLYHVPPELWTQLWQVKPKTLLDIAFKHDFKDMLMRGWAEAMAGNSDQVWLYTVLDDCVVELSSKEHHLPYWIHNLFNALVPTIQEQLVLDLMAKPDKRLIQLEKHGILAQLCRDLQGDSNGQWSLKLSETVLIHMQRFFKPSMGGNQWHYVLNSLASSLHPATIERAKVLYDGQTTTEFYYFNIFTQTLTSRQTIIECFR